MEEQPRGRCERSDPRGRPRGAAEGEGKIATAKMKETKWREELIFWNLNRVTRCCSLQFYTKVPTL